MDLSMHTSPMRALDRSCPQRAGLTHQLERRLGIPGRRKLLNVKKDSFKNCQLEFWCGVQRGLTRLVFGVLVAAQTTRDECFIQSAEYCVL